MKNRFILFSVCLILLPLVACEEDLPRMDDYLVDYATLNKSGNTVTFQLDNNRIIFPKDNKEYPGLNDQRAIINYSPYKDDTVKINNVSPIFTDKIRLQGFQETVHNDPVKVQSIMVSGDYLNLVLEIEYHSKPHSIALFQKTDLPILYFSHSRNDDPPGYPQMMYSSFSLTKLRNEGSTEHIPFSLFINTHEGLREFKLIYK